MVDRHPLEIRPENINNAVVALRGPVYRGIADRLTVPEVLTPEESFDLDDLLERFKTTYLSDPYLLTAFFLTCPIQVSSFYPSNLFRFNNIEITHPTLRRLMSDYLKLLMPHIDLSEDESFYQEFNEQEIGIESLLLICDAKKRLESIPVGHIAYACIPFEGKTRGWYFFLLTNRTNFEELAKINECLRSYRMSKLIVQSLNELPESPMTQHWQIVEALSDNIARVLGLGPSLPIEDFSKQLQMIRWFKDAIYEISQDDIEMYRDTDVSQALTPSSVEDVLNLCKTLPYLSIISRGINVPVQIPCQSAKILVYTYLVLDALNLGNQHDLVIEVVKHLKTNGITTPKLEEYLKQTSS